MESSVGTWAALKSTGVVAVQVLQGCHCCYCSAPGQLLHRLASTSNWLRYRYLHCSVASCFVWCAVPSENTRQRSLSNKLSS